jgi:hypothetical protein
MPQILPASVVVARSDDAVVIVSRIAVYPSGYEVVVTMTARGGLSADQGHFAFGHGRPLYALVGLAYADGRRATLPPRKEAPGEGITLLPLGGSGSDTSFRQTIWVEPLPPEGPVTFAAAWPEQGVAEGTVMLDGSEILAAAQGAVRLWSDDLDDEWPEADFSGAPPLPTEGVRPADAEESERAIRAAFAHLFDNGPQSAEDPLAAVQDGAAFAAVLAEVRSRFPVEAATTRVAVGGVAFLDDVRAAVLFRFLLRMPYPDSPQIGYAVRERGQWKVARDTYARVLGRAGVNLPPPPPPAA